MSQIDQGGPPRHTKNQKKYEPKRARAQFGAQGPYVFPIALRALVALFSSRKARYSTVPEYCGTQAAVRNTMGTSREQNQNCVQVWT